MEKSEQSNVIVGHGRKCWYILHVLPGMERRLMRSISIAGYTVFCPMQVVYRQWKGQLREIIVPLLSGCLFVEASDEFLAYAAVQKISFWVDKESNPLSIYASREEVAGKIK